MANQAKEDQKNERIIRGLLKLPENRRCINCNSLGPQYVCTNFWSFVCTTCSGIHREFTHRVKSVSMAKFTSQEVVALQEGGNQRAKDIFCKEWDPQRQSFPDSSNVEKLRDFVKHVYVDRRFTGEKSYDKPPKGKMGEREDSYENRRSDSYQGGSRSPPYEDATYERRYSDRSSPGGRSDDRNSRYGYDERRSPGYEESRQHNDYRKSPARPEVVNDWRREDRFGNGRKFEDQRLTDGDPKVEGRSPERLKDYDTSSPPVVRPVREILGENVLPLRISEPPKANIGKAADRSEQTKLPKAASSSSLGLANEKPTEVKLQTSVSLIDFDADPEPEPSHVPITATTQTSAQSSSSNNNWASFDFAPEVRSSQDLPSMNPLKSVLSELSGPGPASVSVHTPVFSFSGGNPASIAVNNLSASHYMGASEALPGVIPTLPINNSNPSGKITTADQWPRQPATQQVNPMVNGSPGIQPWNQSFTPAATAAPQLIPKSSLGASSVGLPESLQAKSSGRNALPEDLFTSTYLSYPATIPGWQTGPLPGLGYNMQYNTAVPMQAFSQPSRSTNPFDLNSEPSSVQVQTFPAMASLQGALPSVQPSSGLQRASSLGAPAPSWFSSQSSPYPMALPPQGPTFATAMPPRTYMVQPTTELPNNMPLYGHQGVGNFGGEGSGYGSINMDQQLQLGGRFSAPPTPQPFSTVGGNPFG